MKTFLHPVSFKHLLLVSSISLLSVKTFAADCQFEVKNEWGSGFTAAVTINNDTTETIEGWSVTLDFPDGATMGNPWNGSLTNSSPYTVVNANHNGTINPGDTKSFGFNGNKAVTGVGVVPPTLGGICSTVSLGNLPEPEIQASVTEGSLPLAVTFNGIVAVDTETQPDYQWNFGDGQHNNGQSVEHTYTQAGNYRATLTISDGNSQSSGFVDILVTEPEPEDALCEFSVKNEWGSGFTGEVKITNDGEYAIRGWQVEMLFPDNTSVSGAWDSSHSGNNPYEFVNASYNSTINPGSSVQFGFNAQKGTSGDEVREPSLTGICRQTHTNRPPLAVISTDLTEGTAPLVVHFSGSDSSDPDGDVLSYQWHLNEQLLSDQSNFEYVFEVPGSYQVSLTVNDGQFTSETVQTTINVAEPDDNPGDGEDPEPSENWQLSPEKSSIYFVSTKKTHVMEIHSFETLSGSVDENGHAQLTIALDSVETGIALRNERMREHLFETSLFPETTISLQIEPSLIEGLQTGSVGQLELTPLLDLHGLSLPISATVRITRLDEKSILVVSANPVVIDATEFGLDSGITTLMSLAGLDMISHAVPVNFSLLFEQQ